MASFSFTVLFLNILLLGKVFSYPNSDYTAKNYIEDYGDPGTPLILTRYIENGQIEEARRLSRVEFPGFSEIKSYAGFFTVDKTYDSNQFLWYFPSENIDDQAVLLWLQGGPGISSLFGLFAENGPLQVKNDTFQKRDFHWAKNHHLIYIDNPVGTGFSFTNDTRGYCTNQTQIGQHLYSTLTPFFQLFPELQKLPFFASGESYGGKYVPALGYIIHKNNPTANVKINLKGLIIGNGWSDPINQLYYGNYLYQIGLIDWNQKEEIEELQNEVIEYIKAEAWIEATNLTFDLYRHMVNFMGNISIYNYLPTELNYEDDPAFSDLIKSLSIRKAIHVGNLIYDLSNSTAYNFMKVDMMKSVAPWIAELLEYYQILFYNGQVDIIVAYPLTVNFLRRLNFSASAEYSNAHRYIVYNAGQNDYMEQVGFWKNAGKLTEVLIRNAGHAVPEDQPEWIYNLIAFWQMPILNPGIETKLFEDSKIILSRKQNHVPK